MKATILNGDARTVLNTLAEKSIQCCVTSPPYYGLRDYGTAQWEGGDESCDHKQKRKKPLRDQASEPGQAQYRGSCAKCGARRVDHQIGLEDTPALYIESLVAVFRGVKRALRDNGVLWVVIGDSYASTWSCGRRQ